ncbi:hypothetical protein ACFE04_003291 [Oxalis oulophora]
MKLTCILLFYILSIYSLSQLVKASIFNLSLPHQHPDPESVAHDVHRKVNSSLARRHLISQSQNDQLSCLSGNPIDDCWRCDPNWANNRQRLADCAIGFGAGSLGGKLGQIYVVTDSSDHDPANPTPGTLRHAVIQEVPLWIIFSTNMGIKLKHELIINSYKTIDGRGAQVHITGNGCLTIQYVSYIIIHNIHIHHCKPSGKAMVASSPTHAGYRGVSDGDAWEMYAIGGSASPTINSQGNRYTAPTNPDAKEVTKRVETDEQLWTGWNWRTDGDIMVNGAFFVPSGEGLSEQYAKAESVEPKSVAMINQLTLNVGVFGSPRGSSESLSNPGFNGGGTSSAYSGGGGGSSGGGGDYFGMIFGGGNGAQTATSPPNLLISRDSNLQPLVGVYKQFDYS